MRGQDMEAELRGLLERTSRIAMSQIPDETLREIQETGRAAAERFLESSGHLTLPSLQWSESGTEPESGPSDDPSLADLEISLPETSSTGELLGLVRQVVEGVEANNEIQRRAEVAAQADRDAQNDHITRSNRIAWAAIAVTIVVGLAQIVVAIFPH